MYHQPLPFFSITWYDKKRKHLRSSGHFSYTPLQTAAIHLHFYSSLEADPIGDGGLEIGYCVELFLDLRRTRRLGKVRTTWLWKGAGPEMITKKINKMLC